MTIAIGFCSNAGVIIAADSQETVSGYTKGYRGKIHTHAFPPSGNVVCFAGSGTVDYIDAATEKAIDGVSELKTLPDVRSKIEKNLLEFFDTSLSRWSNYPEQERPIVELLVGVTTRLGAFDLFHYSGTAFHRVYTKAIGAGILLADSLISHYSSRLAEASIEQMGSLAVYIMSKVKSRVDTCGGMTDVVALRRKGDFALTDFKQIGAAESALEEAEKSLDDELRTKIFAVPVTLAWMSDHRQKRKSENVKRSS